MVDLGAAIGGREWWRGLVTCMTLCAAALAFMPSIDSVAGRSPPPMTTAEWEEARVLGIAPLAAAQSAGRRMAPTDAVQALTDAPERAILDLRATLGASGDLFGTLIRSGVSQAEAGRIAEMVGRVVPLGEIGGGTVLDLRLGRRAAPTEPRPVERLRFRATLALRVTIERVGGALALSRAPIVIDEAPLRIQGVVGQSLYRSARAAGLPARIVEAYIRALATQIGVPAGISAGDRFDLVVANRRAETGENEVGALLYAGLDRAGRSDLQIMPWTVGGTTQWFEAAGVGRESSSGFRVPVAGRMTSPFGRRVHPILRYVRMHNGIDFGAPYGAPVIAAASGQVTQASWSGGYGRTVRISHGSGLTTFYGHMSRFAVSPGQAVTAGQLIGYVGSTGMSTGPHLHYELRRDNVPIDPASFRFSTRALLSGGELEAFRGRMRALLAVRPGTPPASGQAASGQGSVEVRPVAQQLPRPVLQPLAPLRSSAL